MSKKERPFTRRDFLKGSFTTTALTVISALTAGCENNTAPSAPHSTPPPGTTTPANIEPRGWWQKGGFIIHDTVDTSKTHKGIIRARVDGKWREFELVKLPEEFVNWSLNVRVARLDRIIRFGGMDPRDLAGSHNACVATYGGPPRDSAVSLNTAYKGMGFVVQPDKIESTTQTIIEEKNRIERDSRYDLMKQLDAKVGFLSDFYNTASCFDRTKQVSLEIFTSAGFNTHTFLNMMANPIASASFLAFPTFEIRAIPQLLHPENPHLSPYEKNLIHYTNAIHDFIHSGSGQRITCVYYVIELFNDTPNSHNRGRRIV